MSLIHELKELPQAIREGLREEFSNWYGLIREAWPILLLLLIALSTLLWLAKPAPPRVVEMAAGRPTDYSYQLAKHYVDFFAKNGVELRLIPTQGSLDNFERLKSEKDTIKVAILQAGLVDEPEKLHGLLSLGSIAYEPIWLFYRSTEAEDMKRPLIEVLKGPLSIGNTGSGTHVKALQLLKINGMSPNPETMLNLPEDQAIEALKSGRIKAMLLVENYESPIVQDLLKANGLIVADFVRAQAYSRLLGYIEVLHVPMGGFDLSRNYPDHDIQLLSTTSTLIVDEDLHPAIQMLLMEASSAIVGHESFFGLPREFPSVKDPSIPLSDVARRYFEKGAPLLSYFAPFWIAEFIARMGLLLLPFLAFAYPLAKSIPEFLERRALKRIQRLYGRLRQIENEVRRDLSSDGLAQQVKALEALEAHVIGLRINKKQLPDLYALRNDIHFVREILNRLLASPPLRNDALK